MLLVDCIDMFEEKLLLVDFIDMFEEDQADLLLIIVFHMRLVCLFQSTPPGAAGHRKKSCYYFYFLFVID
jgi:hypothetical protein